MQTFLDMLQTFVTYLYNTLDSPSCEPQSLHHLSKRSCPHCTPQQLPAHQLETTFQIGLWECNGDKCGPPALWHKIDSCEVPLNMLSQEWCRWRPAETARKPRLTPEVRSTHHCRCSDFSDIWGNADYPCSLFRYRLWVLGLSNLKVIHVFFRLLVKNFTKQHISCTCPPDFELDLTRPCWTCWLVHSHDKIWYILFSPDWEGIPKDKSKVWG